MEKEIFEKLETKLRKMLGELIDDLTPNQYKFEGESYKIKCLSKSIYIVGKLRVADIVEDNKPYINKIVHKLVDMEFSPEQIWLVLEPLMQLREPPYFPYQPKL